MDAFKEVREAARRINNLSLKKGQTFTKAPKSVSLDLSRKLSENRRARMAADPIHAFHARQLSNMHRRISEQGSVTERRKNKMDPSVYPVLLRKKSDKKPPWGFGGAHLSHAAVPTTTSSPMATPRARPQSARASGPRGGGAGGGGDGLRSSVARPASAGPSGRGAAKVKAPERVPGAEYMRPTRKAAKDHPAYQALRKRLLHEIVRKDASEEDMEQIFEDATRQHSGSQQKHVIAQVIADLKVELELQISG